MGGGKNFLVSAAGFSILGNGIFWWKAKTKRLFSQCRERPVITSYPPYLGQNVP
jgi:hypothetical protein